MPGRPVGRVVAAGGKDWARAETETDAQLAATNASLADIGLARRHPAELAVMAELFTARQR